MAIRKRVKHYPGQIKEAVSQMNDMRTGGMLYDRLSASQPLYENDAQLRQKFLNFPKPAISSGVTTSALSVNFPLVPTAHYNGIAKILSAIGSIMERGHQEVPTLEAASGMSDVHAWEASTHAVKTKLSVEDAKRRAAMSAVPLLPYNSPIRAGLTSDVAKKIEKQRIAKDAIRFAERAEIGKQADDLIKSMSGGKMPPAQKNAQIDTTAKGIEKAFKKGSTIRQLRKGLAVTVAYKAASSFIGQELKAYQYGQDISGAALTTGTDPETMAKWSYALRTVGGSEASATKLFSGINKLLQGALMGESSPYFNVADKYGLKLTGHGQGGLATEEELLDRLGEFFRTETSGRKKAHLASILGFDAATIRLFSMNQSDLNKKLNYEFAFTGDEIKSFEDTQMRVNELMVKFENTLMRIVSENGVLDWMIFKGNEFTDWLDSFTSHGKDKEKPIPIPITEKQAEQIAKSFANEWSADNSYLKFDPLFGGFNPSLNEFWMLKYLPDEGMMRKRFEIELKGQIQDVYGNRVRLEEAIWTSPDQSLRINIQ